MTNREKLTKTNIYDLMMRILETGHCPIRLVAWEFVCEEHKDKSCEQCIQDWLNQETDQPKPQWQDAMMKNFLRR